MKRDMSTKQEDATCTRAGRWLLGLAVAMSALGGLGGSFQPSRFLCIAIAFAVVLQIAKGIRLAESARGLRFTSLALAIAFPLLSYCSVLWSAQPGQTFGFAVVMTINMVPLVYVALIPDNELSDLTKELSTGWLIALFLSLALSTYEIATGNHLSFDDESRGGGDFSEKLLYVSGFHGNYNDFSTYLVLTISMVFVSLFLKRANQLERKAIWVCSAAACFVIFLNASRGAILSLTVLGMLFFFAKRHWAKYLASFAAAILIWLIVTQYFSDQLNYLYLKLSDFSNDTSQDSGRFAIWRAMFELFVDSSGFGVGADAYQPMLQTRFSYVIPNPHNFIVEIAINLGLPGLLLWLVHWLVLMATMLRSAAGRMGQLALVSVVALIPLYGIVPSHLMGYTYFWLWYASTVGFARWLALGRARREENAGRGSSVKSSAVVPLNARGSVL
jgi:O-antigen ligase